MLEKDSIRAKQLVALGAVLVFCVAIVVLSLFPFYVSPLAARYRAGDYDWKDDEKAEYHNSYGR